MRYWSVLVLSALLVVPAGVFARPGIVALSDVPGAVMQAAQRAAPEVRWRFALEDRQGGYCVVGQDAQQRNVECLVDPQKRAAVRIDVPSSAVPEAVVAALKEKMPAFQPTKVQACGPDTRTITVYRFQGEGYQGGSAGVYVSITGKKVTPVKE